MWKAMSLKSWTVKKVTVAIAITIVTTAATYSYAGDYGWWQAPTQGGMCS